MFEYLENHQLNIMLGLSSVCFAVGFFTLLTKFLPIRRKIAIAGMEFSACILLYSDRMAYIYHGDLSFEGFLWVRISNFLVFFMTISVVQTFNQYLTDICRNEIEMKEAPFRLKLVEIICFVGWVMVIVSQFTGLYYHFDSNNNYQRGPGFILCYLFPFSALFLQLSVIFGFIKIKKLSYKIIIPMLLFTIMPMVASIVQVFYYGISLTNMTIVGMGVVLYIFAIMEMNDILIQSKQDELEEANKKRLSIRNSFEQTVTTLVNAADSRDRYSRGHSIRVANYSRQIAKEMGMDDREAFRVYHTATLHDIGKLGVPESIITNKGHLTDNEKKILSKHTVLGEEILSSVEELPYLKIAAQYHHERYDGKGFPYGLKGNDIPLYARIVAVADAYDELTSYKSGRAPLAQGKVREILKKAAGQEYDPDIVKIMIGMIDRDAEYMMREADEESVEESDKNDITVVKNMHFDDYKTQVSDGINLTNESVKICFKTRPDRGYERKNAIPAIVLFDSFDRCVHRNERNIKNLNYFEYGEIWLDGHTICTSARDIKTDIVTIKADEDVSADEWISYIIEAVNVEDHVKLKISSEYITCDITVALPDSTRFIFMGITGEHCSIKDISTNVESTSGKDVFIPRIAPKVNYFSRKAGDIPNIEIDGYRENTTVGIPVEDGMRIFFYSQSLPIAHLVYHTAYILLFSSDDGTVNGKNYMEYSCIRLNGDDCTVEPKAENNLIVKKEDDFEGWDKWKERNKNGINSEVIFRRKKNIIVFDTDNAGISIECQTKVPKGTNNVYVAFTGNLCALMDIRIF